jgi:Ca2+-transporting ATPase
MTVQRLYVNSQTLKVTGTGYAPQGEFQREDKAFVLDESLRILLNVVVLCNDSNLEKDPQTGKWVVKGDPTEGALVVAAAKAGISKEEIELLEPRDCQVLTGQELEEMTDEQLAQVVENVVVYARVAPEHKTRIVKA